MASVGGVPGRLERVDAGQDFLAVVDYAHKPDAVEAALHALAAADRRAGCRRASAPAATATPASGR